MSTFENLDQRLFEIFTAWFHCDLLPDGDAEIISLARICASDLRGKKLNLEGIRQDLCSMLNSWQTHYAKPFSDATTTDWLADQHAEALLQSVLRQLVKDLQFSIEKDHQIDDVRHV